jgi:hydroxylaminobenzene mutase
MGRAGLPEGRVPVFANPRMGVEMHVTGLQSGMALWAMGLMWQRVALPAGAERTVQILAVAGLYATVISLLLSRVMGNQPRHADRRRRPSGEPSA